MGGSFLELNTVKSLKKMTGQFGLNDWEKSCNGIWGCSIGEDCGIFFFKILIRKLKFFVIDFPSINKFPVISRKCVSSVFFLLLKIKWIDVWMDLKKNIYFGKKYILLMIKRHYERKIWNIFPKSCFLSHFVYLPTLLFEHLKKFLVFMLIRLKKSFWFFTWIV